MLVLSLIHIFKLGFDEATVVSWIIIAVMTVLAIILTRNLKVTGEISKRQADVYKRQVRKSA